MTWNGRVPALRRAANRLDAPPGRSGEHPDQDPEVPHQEVPEQHVEEQLLVVPLRAIGAPAKLGDGGRVNQAPEVIADAGQLRTDLLRVHGILGIAATGDSNARPTCMDAIRSSAAMSGQRRFGDRRCEYVSSGREQLYDSSGEVGQGARSEGAEHGPFGAEEQERRGEGNRE